MKSVAVSTAKPDSAEAGRDLANQVKWALKARPFTQAAIASRIRAILDSKADGGTP